MMSCSDGLQSYSTLFDTMEESLGKESFRKKKCVRFHFFQLKKKFSLHFSIIQKGLKKWAFFLNDPIPKLAPMNVDE